MNTYILILMMILSTFIGALGSMFLKKGSDRFVIKLSYKGIADIIKNWHIMLGIALFVFSTVFFIFLLRTERLSLLYPMTSLGYIFIVFLSVFILKEKMNAYKIIGIGMIILGVVLVTL